MALIVTMNGKSESGLGMKSEYTGHKKQVNKDEQLLQNRHVQPKCVQGEKEPNRCLKRRDKS